MCCFVVCVVCNTHCVLKYSSSLYCELHSTVLHCSSVCVVVYCPVYTDFIASPLGRVTNSHKGSHKHVQNFINSFLSFDLSRILNIGNILKKGVGRRCNNEKVDFWGCCSPPKRNLCLPGWVIWDIALLIFTMSFDPQKYVNFKEMDGWSGKNEQWSLFFSFFLRLPLILLVEISQCFMNDKCCKFLSFHCRAMPSKLLTLLVKLHFVQKRIFLHHISKSQNPLSIWI